MLAIGAFFMVLPFFWMVNASLMTSGEIQSQPPVWLPEVPQVGNYGRLLEVMPLPRLYANSLFVTICTTLGVLLTSEI
jgi:multiple sugar transport system permease protein